MRGKAIPTVSELVLEQANELRRTKADLKRLLTLAEAALFWWSPAASQDPRAYAQHDHQLLKDMVRKLKPTTCVKIR